MPFRKTVGGPGGPGVAEVGRPLGDHHHLGGEPGGAPLGCPVRLAAGAAGAQGVGDFAAQAAAGLHIDRLVDRLRAHSHHLVVRMVDDQSVADLFGRPLQGEFAADVVAQRPGSGQLGRFGP